MTDSERVHLIVAMQLNPTKKQSHDIIRKLCLVRYQGQLVFPAQAEALKARQKRADAALRDWKPRLARLSRDIEVRDVNKRSKAIAELRALRDPAAIPALESVFAKARPAAGEATVAALAAMPGQPATDSLLRFAVLADQEDVRTAAATALGTRNVYAYVPTLISALQAPVEVTFEADFSSGLAHHRLVLFQEGPVVDQKFTRIDGNHEEVIYSRRLGRVLSEKSIGDQTLEIDAARASAEVAANDERERLNARILAALKTATGKDHDDKLKLWWDWWLSENEIYQTPYKQVAETTSFTPAVQVRYVSCFPAGTPVETSTGALPIEQIKAGDCVLAQDPDSGELAYKPVMAVTLRPPSPLIEVHTAKETIRAMRGHPFWVSGIGWQMAKELQPGQWLHTTAGPVQIESVDQRGETECHNLIVADFHSYFVGQEQILVHDNNLRDVTTATVPGLVNP